MINEPTFFPIEELYIYILIYVVSCPLGYGSQDLIFLNYGNDQEE